MLTRSALRVAIALAPVAVVPVLVHLLASGRLDLGAGEKDLVWVFPWMLWSVLFALSSFVLWHRGLSVARSTLWSAVVGLGGVLLAAIVLAALGQLGIGGRF